MIKVESINLNFDITVKHKEEVYISDSKVVIGWMHDNKMCYHLYDFTKAQERLNTIKLDKERLMIDNVIDTDCTDCEVGDGDIISNIRVDEDRNINITLGVFTDNLDEEFIVNPIPNDMNFSEIIEVEYQVFKINIKEEKAFAKMLTLVKTKK